MISFAEFLRDLFCLANAHRISGASGDGRGFERLVARHFAAVGVRQVDAFSGVSVLGSQSLSGLYHQVDATADTRDAIVIGEWKAYRDFIPKNELMRFKAATDDYWLCQYPFAIKPVMRVFGGTGHVSPALRRYAAQWGICVVTPDRWPAPLLASGMTTWPEDSPDRLTRRYLTWLCRPLDCVYVPQPDGRLVISKPPRPEMLDHFLALHDTWSEQLWQRFRQRPGKFEDWMESMLPLGRAA